ncbi:MAG: hypothetical protein UY10_C0023G0005 [Microgenomates group bacterium GW2011_GWA2_47_8]|nr:MAG: hypothetical protein UY10_C0023G0005 [Microgenomates group bacterium GW2011_GWA2_47_8]
MPAYAGLSRVLIVSNSSMLLTADIGAHPDGREVQLY